jgi:hypothetical protein
VEEKGTRPAANAKVGDPMRSNLWCDNGKVGEIISDKPLVKGDIVQTVWRVVDAYWQVDAGDPTNSVSSGNVLVEPVKSRPVKNGS